MYKFDYKSQVYEQYGQSSMTLGSNFKTFKTQLICGR